MTISNLTDKNIGVLGLGREGLAVVKYLKNHGIGVTVYDKNNVTTQDMDVKLVSGEEYLRKAIDECEIIFRSPGVKIPIDLAKTVEEKNIIITSQTIWFFDNCPAQIIGVTGTKGKGTTCSLIQTILEKHSMSNPESRVYLTGNIGKDQPFEFIDQLSKNDLIIYELSSFQLQDLKVSPAIGITLMVTEDHLDYHSDLDEYHLAKSAISTFQSEENTQIYNIDYSASKKIGELGAGQKWQISSKEEVAHGATILDDSIIVRGVSEADIIFDTKIRNLRGRHNLENIAAAVLAGLVLGVDQNHIQECISSFKGLKHRLQLVSDIDGVKYYNDSISTIPEATVAALNSFTEPTILLLGGASKKLDYTNLINALSHKPNLKAVVTLGETGAELSKLIHESAFKGDVFGPYTNFSEAIVKSKSLAKPGDIVLLSPAATSFDMFESYMDRGDQFIDLVSK